jgi:hypothetical protein
VFVDDGDDLSCRSRRRRRRWRDGEESSRSESLVIEQLHLVETEIGIEGETGTETIGRALAHHPHPIVPHHVHGRGHEAENSVAAHHQKAVHIQIRYVPREETVPEDHIPGTNKIFYICCSVT